MPGAHQESITLTVRGLSCYSLALPIAPPLRTTSPSPSEGPLLIGHCRKFEGSVDYDLYIKDLKYTGRYLFVMLSFDLAWKTQLD